MPLPVVPRAASPKTHKPCRLQALPQELIDAVILYLDSSDMLRFRSSAHWANDCVRALKHPSMGLTRVMAPRPAARQTVGQFIDHQAAAREAIQTGRVACEHIVDDALHHFHSYVMPGAPRAFVTMPGQGLVHIDASASPPICVVASATTSGAQHKKPRAQILEARDIADGTNAAAITVLQSNNELGVWVWRRPTRARYTALHQSCVPDARPRDARELTRLSADGQSLLTHLPGRYASCLWRLCGDTFVAAEPQNYVKPFNLEAHSPTDGMVFRAESPGFCLLRPSTGETWRSTQAWPRVLSTDGFSPTGKSLWLTLLPKVDEGDDESTAMRSIGLFQVAAHSDGTVHLSSIDTAPVGTDSMVSVYDWRVGPDEGWGRSLGIWSSALTAHDSAPFVRRAYTLTETPQPGTRDDAPSITSLLESPPEGVWSAGEDGQGAQMVWHAPHAQDADLNFSGGRFGRRPRGGEVAFSPAHQTFTQLLFARHAGLHMWAAQPWRLHWRPDLSRALVVHQQRRVPRDLWPSGPPLALTLRILRLDPSAPALFHETHLGRWFAAEAMQTNAADAALV